MGSFLSCLSSPRGQCPGYRQILRPCGDQEVAHLIDQVTPTDLQGAILNSMVCPLYVIHPICHSIQEPPHPYLCLASPGAPTFEGLKVNGTSPHQTVLVIVMLALAQSTGEILATWLCQPSLPFLGAAARARSRSQVPTGLAGSQDSTSNCKGSELPVAPKVSVLQPRMALLAEASGLCTFHPMCQASSQSEATCVPTVL
jgi:hypothetical protein